MFSATSSVYSGGHELLEAAPDELFDRAAEQARKLRIGVADRFAVNQHRFVHAIAERADRRTAERQLIDRAAGARQQMIHGRYQRGELRLIGLQLDSGLQGAADGGALHLPATPPRARCSCRRWRK